jgi:thymidylate synthase
MSTFIASVRNVNIALRQLMAMSQYSNQWRSVSPRGMETMEYRGTFITEYEYPCERVLFSAVRDANPFFHFMEALWIMDGRDDVAFLNQFNSNISTFSDDGKTFNAPYGYRLRKHFQRVEFMGSSVGDVETIDQIEELIDLLQREPDTRRAVLCLWDPLKDLNRDSRDIPCNDLVTFKLRDGVLDMTVMNRSNDAMWGAYGANAVQFSTLQEFIASAVGAEVGVYRQISDSFHVYTGQAAWLRCTHAARTGSIAMEFDDPYVDHYGKERFNRLPLIPKLPKGTLWGDGSPWREWLFQNHLFLQDKLND